jgi:3-hydroxybutyryl-CoA dehydrogenase
MDFERAAVIGTGMMGPGIAVVLAMGGLEATIVGRTEASAAKGLNAARDHGRMLAEHGLAELGILERVKSISDLERAVRDADLVVESTPEDLTFKQDLFARLESFAKPAAVLASNTSALSITALAAKCSRPERTLTTHFWNPAFVMPLVEIVQGERTSPEVAEAVRDLLRRCGKVPVLVKKDRPGQLGNRLQSALFREAIHIVEEGIADAEDVDLAAKCGFGLRLPVYGMFEHQDAVGLDLVLSVVNYVSPDLYREREAPELLRTLVADKKLGVKSGSGFYDWSVKSIEEVKQRRDAFVLEMAKRWRRQEG